MTREEAVRPLAMLRANWPFLDFSDQVTAELWMAAFEPYMEAEVRQGITEAIANISRTPTVADILEYVRAVHDGTRRAEAEAYRNREESESVNCWECNDHGFVNIIYPNGDEAVRPCNCQTVDRIFGKQTLQDMRKPMPKWKQATLFGESTSSCASPGSRYRPARHTRTRTETSTKGSASGSSRIFREAAARRSSCNTRKRSENDRGK